MELNISEKEIRLQKELSALDCFTVEFTTILNNQGINYVVVSGYVAIVFGRNRASEDIDIILEKMPKEAFKTLWRSIPKTWWCINTDEEDEAYSDFLCNKTSLRFSRVGEAVPNIEIKFSDDEVDDWSIKNKVKLFLNDNVLSISPLELQIAFKCYLGSDKDKEDALYLYTLFKEKLNKTMMLDWGRKFNIEKDILKMIK